MVLQEFRKRLYVSLEGKPGTVSCRTGGRRRSLHKWGQKMPVAGRENVRDERCRRNTRTGSGNGSTHLPL